MKIGDLSRATGVSPRSLRYYEQQYLLRSERTPGGQRLYDEDAIERVELIQLLFGAGVPSTAIVELLPCIYSGTTTPEMIARLLIERDRIRAEHARITRTLERLDTVIREAGSRIVAGAAWHQRDTIPTATSQSPDEPMRSAPCEKRDPPPRLQDRPGRGCGRAHSWTGGDRPGRGDDRQRADADPRCDLPAEHGRRDLVQALRARTDRPAHVSAHRLRAARAAEMDTRASAPPCGACRPALGHGVPGRAVIATRVLAVISRALAQLLALAVVRLLVAILQTR